MVLRTPFEDRVMLFFNLDTAETSKLSDFWPV